MSVIYISEQGARLQKQAGRFIVSKSGETLFEIPETSVDRIAIFGNVQVTSQAVNEILKKGIELLYLSKYGRFNGILEPGFPKNVFMRLAQYETSLDMEFSTNFAREIVSVKIATDLKILSKWKRNSWLENEQYTKIIIKHKTLLIKKESISECMGIEGMVAKIYFTALGETIPPPFVWEGRNRRPPLDPVNALLSLTYMMLLGEIISSCYIHGLDPYIGYLHQLDYGRPSFALDILEPARALYCDHFVMRLLQREVFSLVHFEYSDKNGCRLKSDGFKKYLCKYQEFLTNSKLNKYSMKTFIDKLVTKAANAIKEHTAPIFTDLI